MTKRTQSSTSQLPVPVASAPEPGVDSGRTRKSGGSTSFAAQLFGQPGRKRGLKGGPPVLTEARSAYLEAEFSGTFDRRPQAGKITKTKI